MFAVRGIVFSHEAVREWEAKLTPALAEDLRRRRRGKVGRSWYVDETYLKVQGRWCYLYRAIDRYGDAGRRAVQRAPRHGGGAGVLPLRQGGHRGDTGPGHDGRPRQLPPGDPDRAGQGRAAPDQPLPEQQAGAGSPGHQRPIPTHAGLQVPEISRPVLPRLTMNCATSSASAPAITSMFPPIAADCSSSGGP